MKERAEGATPPKESREEESQPITFHVTEKRLDTAVDEVMSDEDYRKYTQPGPNGALKTDNRRWYAVTVASEEDKKRWIELQNEYLACQWTSNQNSKERLKNQERAKKIVEELRELESKAGSEE